MSSWNVHRKVLAERTHLKTYADIPRQSRKQCSARPQIHSEYRDSCFPACRQSLATYLFVSPSLIVLSFSSLHALSISTLKYLRQKRTSAKDIVGLCLIIRTFPSRCFFLATTRKSPSARWCAISKQHCRNADIYVYDNNSTDRTAEIATSEGAIVRKEPRRARAT